MWPLKAVPEVATISGVHCRYTIYETIYETIAPSKVPRFRYSPPILLRGKNLISVESSTSACVESIGTAFSQPFPSFTGLIEDRLSDEKVRVGKRDFAVEDVLPPQVGVGDDQVDELLPSAVGIPGAPLLKTIHANSEKISLLVTFRFLFFFFFGVENSFVINGSGAKFVSGWKEQKRQI